MQYTFFLILIILMGISCERKNEAKKNREDIRKETELKKKQGTVKGVLKQIMNDDSNLQKKYIKSKSNDSSQSKKDW